MKKTIETKVFYTAMIFILLWFVVIMLTSCMSSIYKVRKEQIKVTHVLAITETGDTLKIPIESIKPNVFQLVRKNLHEHHPWKKPRYRFRDKKKSDDDQASAFKAMVFVKSRAMCGLV